MILELTTLEHTQAAMFVYFLSQLYSLCSTESTPAIVYVFSYCKNCPDLMTPDLNRGRYLGP